MAEYREIRADFDRESIVVYQAYRKQIALPAIKEGRFVPPFSWNRMTWIKPSFLWMMSRSGWGKKSGQEHILAIRISRAGRERALFKAELTHFDPSIHRSESEWRDRFEIANVHVQWDPERSIHGKKLEHRAIQVGVSRRLIEEYTNDWILEIIDYTALVKKIRALYLSGNVAKAKKLLPKEKAYSIPIATRQNLGIN